MRVNITDAWKLADVRANVAGNWRLVAAQWTRVDGVWRRIDPPVALPMAFVQKANLNTAVYHAHLINVAEVLYNLGGMNILGTKLTNLYAYNATANTWASKAAFPAGVQNGTVFTISGLLYLKASESTALYCYNPATNTWSTKAVGPTMQNAPVAIYNGKAYLVSTIDTNVYCYDPVANTWTTIASAAPFNSSSAPAQSPASAQVGDTLWISGGLVGSPHLYQYHIPTNTWTRYADLPIATLYGHQMLYYDHKLYTIGGWNGSAEVTTMYVYDMATNTWSTFLANVTYSNYQNRIARLGNQWYVAGGSSNGGGGGVSNGFYKFADV